MAETNLYKLLSGLYTAASNINTKVGNKNNNNGSAFEQLTALSTAVDGKFTPRLANGTSGLVYSANGGDVNIAAGVITLKNGVVDTAELKNGAVTADKLASTVSSQIGHGETAYGKVSGDEGDWHKHGNLTTLNGIGDTDITHWNDAYAKEHTHANSGVLDGITSTKIAAWDAASTANHSHTNKTVLDGITSAKVADWDKAATSAHFHTNKAVLDGITAAKITAWDNGAKISGVTLEKLTTPTAGYAASYQLKVNGSTTNIPTIDIVKDQFIKSATFGWSTAADSTGAGWTTTKSSTAKYPCIKIEVYTNANGVSTDDTAATPIYVPLADVFQEYVGGANVKVDGNVISLSGTIPDGNIASATSWNTAATRAADWNTSKATVVKTSAATTFKDGTVVLGTGSSQTVKNSEYTIATGSANFGANTLATAPAITGYIAAQGFQKSASMGSYVTGANLDLDTIVMGAGGTAVKKGVKIVSTSGDINTAASGAMVPTAGAVSSYVANKTTGMVTGTGLTADKLVAGNNGGAVKITSIATGDVVTAAANLTSGKLVVAAGNSKAIAGTSYGVNTASGSVGAANQISTDDALTGYFASKNADFVSASADLTKDQIILGNDAKTVRKSGLTVGTTSGSIGTASTASATIPRSDAVSSYVAGKTANMVTAGANLTNNNLIVGNGSKGVTATSIAAANVVTASNALADNDIVLGAGANKTIKKSGYSITSGAADVTSGATDKVPTASAVKSYIDGQDDAAKNYLLNGDAATSGGVTEWAGGDTTVGSLAELNAKVNALLTSIK